MKFEEAVQSIEEELKAVEAEMTRNMLSEIVMIPTVSRYLISSGGKRFRPVLLLLCARLGGYQGPRAVPLASTIEYIHAATLLHDDVVDQAYLRRGIASANSVWGNGASVLVGDFLYTKAFALIVKDGDLHILEIISHAANKMAEGEVKQLVGMGNPEITEDDYYFVVLNKTAGLISAACRIGGILGRVSPEREGALKDFGLHLGTGFQLMDDTLDYISEEGVLGKAIGKDLNEGKITLPLIHALRVCSKADRERIVQVIRDPARREEELAYVMKVVQESRGIDYTLQRAREAVTTAKAALAIFPFSREKEDLLAISDYTITRKW